MANILISGGAGFIGSHLALKLLKKGHQITVLDNLSPQIHLNANQSGLYKSIKDKVTFIKGDVRNKEDWIKSIKKSDIIVHLAAETGTGQSMYELQKYVDVNSLGTAVMLDVLSNIKNKVRKVILASSRSVYGEGKYFCEKNGTIFPGQRTNKQMSEGKFEILSPYNMKPLTPLPTDEDSKIHPTSIYGITKNNQEQLVLASCKSLGISAIALRYQNVYGPGQSLINPYTGILSIFSTRILNNNPVYVFEDGMESRDFVFIDDVIDATVLSIEDNIVSSDSFNVGSGESINILAVAESLKKMYHSNIDIKITGTYRLGDIRHNKADISKINSCLGYSPKVSFEFGLQKFVNWVKTQNIELDNYDQSIFELKNKGLIK